MKTVTKRMLSATLAVLTILTACLLGSCKGGSKEARYYIGCTGPLTGDAAQYGVSVKDGAELAVEEINAAGGLNGVPFFFDMKDDRATAQDAVTGYNTLMDAGMQVSLGSVTSGSCEAFAAEAKKDNLFLLTPSASMDSIIRNRPNAFRVCFGDPDQGILAARQIAKDYEKVGVIYDTSEPYSTGVYDAFKGEMEKLGKAYTVKTFDKDNNKDFSVQVEALKDCDVIFLPIYYTEAGLIAKACTQKGCKSVLFGCDGFDGIAKQIDKSVTSHIKYITPFDVTATDDHTVKFVKAYRAKYNHDPDQFAADGYDAVYTVFEAMKKAGVNNPDISVEELCEKLIATFTSKDFEFHGVTGVMTWDASGAANKVPVIRVVQ